MIAPEILRAERLTAAGFAHGFSTRIGGASEGPYASLNLGRSVGDDPTAVAENHRRLAAAVGYTTERLFDASQVHGSAVVTLRGDDQTDEVGTRRADALVASEKGAAVGVRTADCVPVLVAEPATGRVAAIHAGWRGVVAGVVREALDALTPRDRGQLVAAIGPSIGPCCFEVDGDVATVLAEAGGDGIVLRRDGDKPHVDLWRAIEHQLRRAGVTTIDTLGRCTMCEGEYFFSFRRDGAQSGRMLSVIVARGA
jgi:YfiH family protein